MKIPLLDIDAQLKPLDHELLECLKEVLYSRRFIMGPQVGELECQIAGYCGTKDAVGVSSGTDALLLSLMGLEVGPGDIVITSDYSFFASAGVIARLGATPVFIDIDPDTYNIDPRKLREWLESNGDRSRVKALMPVHLYGQCADMQAIMDIAEEFKIPVVEDAAQALGSRCNLGGEEKQAGAMGLAGCFSFYPSKNLGALGDAGIITTNDKDFAEKLRKLRNHGAAPKYYHSMIGGNFRLDTIQAAALLVKLPHLNSWHEGRRKNAARYDKAFAETDIGTPKPTCPWEHHIYNQYVISVPDRRDELRSYLGEKEIGSEVYYPVPFHQQECFQYLGNEAVPASAYAANHTLAIPIYPELSVEMQDYVIENILRFYSFA